MPHSKNAKIIPAAAVTSMMETVLSFETSANIYQTVQRNIPEHSLQTRHNGNVKRYSVAFMST